MFIAKLLRTVLLGGAFMASVWGGCALAQEAAGGESPAAHQAMAPDDSIAPAELPEEPVTEDDMADLGEENVPPPEEEPETGPAPADAETAATEKAAPAPQDATAEDAPEQESEDEKSAGEESAEEKMPAGDAAPAEDADADTGAVEDAITAESAGKLAEPAEEAAPSGEEAAPAPAEKKNKRWWGRPY